MRSASARQHHALGRPIRQRLIDRRGEARAPGIRREAVADHEAAARAAPASWGSAPSWAPRVSAPRAISTALAFGISIGPALQVPSSAAMRATNSRGVVEVGGAVDRCAHQLAAASARSTGQEQVVGSATRQHAARPPDGVRSAVGSRVVSATGPFDSTQVSAVRPPRCRLTARASLSSACARSRPASPAGAPRLARKSRRLNGRSRGGSRAAPAWSRASPCPPARSRCRDRRSPPGARSCGSRSASTPSPASSRAMRSANAEAITMVSSFPAIAARTSARPTPPGGDIRDREISAERRPRERRQVHATALASIRPAPSPLAITTVPSRTACTRPGTPSREAGVELERIAAVGIEPAQQHRRAAGRRAACTNTPSSRTVRSSPSTSRKPRYRAR